MMDPPCAVNGYALHTPSGYAARQATGEVACCFFNADGSLDRCEELLATDCVLDGGIPRGQHQCSEINCEPYRIPCCIYEGGELVGCEMSTVWDCLTPMPFDWDCWEAGASGGDPLWGSMRCDHPCALPCPEPEPDPADPPECDFCGNAPLPRTVVVGLKGFEWCPEIEYPSGSCSPDQKHRLGLAIERLLNSSYAIPAREDGCGWYASLSVQVREPDSCVPPGGEPEFDVIILNIGVTLVLGTNDKIRRTVSVSVLATAGHSYSFSRVEPTDLDEGDNCGPFGGAPTSLINPCACGEPECDGRLSAASASLTVFM